jgi:hypothetical protein
LAAALEDDVDDIEGQHLLSVASHFEYAVCKGADTAVDSPHQGIGIYPRGVEVLLRVGVWWE